MHKSTKEEGREGREQAQLSEEKKRTKEPEAEEKKKKQKRERERKGKSITNDADWRKQSDAFGKPFIHPSISTLMIS